MGQYEQVMQRLRAAFLSGKTRCYDWRVSQLMALIKFFDQHRNEIEEALFKDLHKPKFEADALDIIMCRSAIVDTINNLKAWMKPNKVVKDTINMMDNCYTLSEPYGTALIIGAWNYPFQLTILPLIGAIAAGNCAVIKPSEVSANSATLLEKCLPNFLDQDCFQVITGGVPETTALLEEKFDLIFYTGNGTVGRIIMTAAAKHLTPVVLELGGKSPVYVDRGTDLAVVAKRISWGKFTNAGQTCIAPDYIMCPSDIQAELIEKLKATITEFYTENPEKSESYARIINERHHQRLQQAMEGASIALGGDGDKETKYFSPTVLKDVKTTDIIMQDEIFGPVLPILPMQNHKEALEFINSRDKPLALYVFTNDSKMAKDFRDNTSSGGLLINDTVVHAGLPTLPFGGVGPSGQGAYHGKHSFDAFSHSKAVMEKALSLDQLNSIRYPPYTEKKLSWLEWFMSKKLKKRGVFSFLPFMILGTMLALFMKVQR